MTGITTGSTVRRSAITLFVAAVIVLTSCGAPPTAADRAAAPTTRAAAGGTIDGLVDGEVTTPREQPHTADLDVNDLHALVQAIGETGPKVFVAHSYGGVVAALYARTHPDEVAGLVMVDTAPSTWPTTAAGGLPIRFAAVNCHRLPHVDVRPACDPSTRTGGCRADDPDACRPDPFDRHRLSDCDPVDYFSHD